MANPALTDMTEEDAADLQFPKGKTNPVGYIICLLIPNLKKFYL